MYKNGNHIFNFPGSYKLSLQVNRETIGQDLATSGSGFAMLATSFGSMSGPPIAGFLYGETESYKNVFYLAGKCYLYTCTLCVLY